MENRNSEILAQKSRELLNDQLNSIDSNNSKAGTFVSISSLFIPLAFGLFDNFEKSTTWIFVFSIPIILNLVGLYFLIKSLFPKKMYHGINFSEFDILINKEDSRDIYDFEIGANRDSFNDNKETLKKQNNNLKYGLIFIFVSAICLTLIFFINVLVINCSSNG
ncbi:hypothetical protein U1E44_07075 [Arenibacter sp. GZD96]|uniref:hypothetical protein n=1 Tax=Aurantibrevibacter litoralis TaxID=3106030 RepID=UPI002AFDF1FA|nr:hypothetical protein [Arenibacter sp. GZD-96]MEA1785847.1 hypothetical protein [Arenibacter sp. GZD-96]